MQVRLVRASIEDAGTIWRMQREAFAALLEKYHDDGLNPASEPLEKVRQRFRFPATAFYFIEADGETVGAIRVIDHHSPDRPKKISPLFVLPAYRGKGIAQRAIREAERIHGSEHWMLDTILQEAGNCHLYEKLGYRRTGDTQVVNEYLTLVTYAK